MSGGRIRDEQGYLTTLGRQLGEERFGEFVAGHGHVQAMSMFLTMAVVSAPSQGYSDAALDILISDAEDVRSAAAAWADSCIELAQAWRKQRTGAQAQEPKR